jgi:anti-sigma factor RsiW
MPLLAAAVLTMSAAQLLDLATFVAMVRAVGPGAEANPLVASLFGAYGFPLVAIAKVVLVAMTTAIVAMLLRVRPRPRLAGAVLAVGIAVGIVGGISNSAVLAAAGVRLWA